MAHKLLFGKDSLENSAVAPDYPYGFILRTEMHYFVEQNKKGWRAVTQSLNPKTGKMNKPKQGTYHPLPIYVAVNDENGYFEFVYVPRWLTGWNGSETTNVAQEFIDAYWLQLPEGDRKYIKTYFSLAIISEYHGKFELKYPEAE